MRPIIFVFVISLEIFASAELITQCKKRDASEKIDKLLNAAVTPDIVSETTPKLAPLVKGDNHQLLSRETCKMCSSNVANCRMDYSNFTEIVCVGVPYHQYLASEALISELSYEGLMGICKNGGIYDLIKNIILYKNVHKDTPAVVESIRLFLDKIMRKITSLDKNKYTKEVISQYYCVSVMQYKMEVVVNKIDLSSNIATSEFSSMYEKLFIDNIISPNITAFPSYIIRQLTETLGYFYMKTNPSHKIEQLYELVNQSCNLSTNKKSCRLALQMIGGAVYALEFARDESAKKQHIKIVNKMMRDYIQLLIKSGVVSSHTVSSLDEPYLDEMAHFYAIFTLTAFKYPAEILETYNTLPFLHPLKHPLFRYMNDTYHTKLENVKRDGISLDRFILNHFARHEYNKTLRKVGPFIVRVELRTYFEYKGEFNELIIKAVELFVDMFRYQTPQKEKILVIKGVLLDSDQVNMARLNGFMGYLGVYIINTQQFSVFNFRISNGKVDADDLHTMMHEMYHAMTYQGLIPGIVKSIRPYEALIEGIAEQLSYTLLYVNGIARKIDMVKNYNFSSFDPSFHILTSPRDQTQKYINNYIFSHIFLQYLYECDHLLFYQIFSEDTYVNLKRYNFNQDMFNIYVKTYIKDLTFLLREIDKRHIELRLISNLNTKSFWTKTQRRCNI